MPTAAPSGENPGGTFTVFDIAHTVSCLQVSGDTAVNGLDANTVSFVATWGKTPPAGVLRSTCVDSA